MRKLHFPKTGANNKFALQGKNAVCALQINRKLLLFPLENASEMGSRLIIFSFITEGSNLLY